MTPNVAIVHVNCPCGPNFRLWLPLFLLWIPAILLAPFILLGLSIGCLVARISVWPVISVLWGLLCSLPGTDIRVTSEGNRLLVRIL